MGELVVSKKDSLTYVQYQKIVVKHEKGNYRDALKEALVLLEQCNKTNNTTLKSAVAELIADIYREIGEIAISTEYYKRSLQDLHAFNHDKTALSNDTIANIKARMFLKIGGNFQRTFTRQKFRLNKFYSREDKDFDAINALKEITAQNRDSAIYYYDQLEQIQTLNTNIQHQRAKGYINIAGIYQMDSTFTKAEHYILKSIEINKTNNDSIVLAGAYCNLGNVFLMQNKFELAKKNYFEGINYVHDIKSPKAIRISAKLYYNLAWAMRNLNEVKAYDNLETSYEFEEDLRKRDLKKIIKQIETDHNATLKKLENEKEINIAKLKKKNTTYLFAALTALILIASAVVIYNIRLRQRNLQLKLKQNKLLEKQNIDRLKSESQIKILNATIDGKETERKQIAETLHDSVSALLSSANMHLSATKKQFDGEPPVELEKTREIILEASQKVRDLSHNLVSSILLKFGLEYALKDITKKYSNTELSFHSEFNNINRYNQEFEIKIYNVIHELINNIIKHSLASNAYIVLEEQNEFLSILIEDDGVGFNYRKSTTKSGLGLNQIEARIQMMNGNFLIETATNKGTKITISVPAPKKTAVSLV
ncbi:tetratricopeptide repeat-containing sensor histidine kinase [Tenacibaculum litopenaei]|uniref:tetratricopeptide repeat-containing sensor histidine kinase n=1 Tax=Tenacibaculum litopenaei TaxID=396016 RepID=UPI0038B4E799